MTKLYVREYAFLGRTEQSDSIDVAFEDGSATDQVVDFTSGATASSAFQSSTKWVLLCADAGCSIKFSPSASPVAAAATNWRLPANVPRLFRVPDIKPIVNQAAVTYQVSAISNA